MRDPARIKRILEKLGRAWAQHPDQRLAQLVINLTRSSKAIAFHVEDDAIEAALDTLLTDGKWP